MAGILAPEPSRLTITLQVVIDPAAPAPLTRGGAPTGIPTATITPDVSTAQLGAWLRDVLADAHARAARLVGDAADLEVVYRPGAPGTIDALHIPTGASYHTVVPRDEMPGSEAPQVSGLAGARQQAAHLNAERFGTDPSWYGLG